MKRHLVLPMFSDEVFDALTLCPRLLDVISFLRRPSVGCMISRHPASWCTKRKQGCVGLGPHFA